MFKKILFDSFIYAILPRITMVFSLFLMPITTKYLTDFDYGVWGIIAAYSGLLAGFSELGMGVNLSNVYFKHPKFYKLVWRNIMGFLFCWGLIFSLVFSILLFFIIPNEALENRWVLIGLIIIPSVIFSPINRIGTLYYQLGRKPIPVTTISVAFSIVSVILIYYFVVELRLGYMSWAYANFITTVGAGLIYTYLFLIRQKYLPILKFNKSTFKRYLSVGLPIIPHKYASYLLNSSDRVVMDFLQVPTSRIGQYNFGYDFGNKAKIFAEGINKGYRPYILKILSSDNSNRIFLFRKLTFLILGAMIFTSGIGCLWMKEVFYLLIDNENTPLLEMYPLAIIVVMSFNFGPMYQSVSTFLTFNEKTNELWKMSFVAGIINVISNLIFIPLYGIEAAAFTTMAAMLYLGFRGLALKSFKEKCQINMFGFYWIVAIVGMTLLAYLLSGLHIAVKLSITMAYISFILLNFKRIKNYISELL
tara:strand:- start:547 stop:1974 length:1428 start_codon:yes stop_codon:yes gene_type:complete